MAELSIRHNGSTGPAPSSRRTWLVLLLLMGWVRLAWGSDPADAAGHWAFQPVKRPPVPAVTNAAWVRTPIDAFVARRLAQEGLGPAAEADRRTLIRRVSFDLVGLPPTPEEVRAFEADPAPDAYERLVDRLLASPRHGERWGRHWLDVVRFAETHGFEMNNPRPNAWPYRDYVIRAFNEDKPYDQFVREQIAGDLLGADEATGFLVAGPWDQVKSPDEVLTRNQRADELHDMVNTVGTAFLGLTVGCARCHDHKFDPIPQTDYFAVKAVLAGVQHGERPWRQPEEVTRAREVEQWRMELAGVERALDAAEPVVSLDPAAPPHRAPVTARRNIERIPPVTARFVRFTVEMTSGGEPCIDELEIFAVAGADGARTNLARATAGARLTASGTYPNSEIHRLEHLNDGRYGNDRSWISNEPGRGWVTVELREPSVIDRLEWSRDRSPEARFGDRLATRYRIDVSTDGADWTTVATSADRREAGAAGGEDSLGALRKRRDELERQIREALRRPAIYGGVFATPEPTRRFHRGDPMQPREEVPAGVLTFAALRGEGAALESLPEPERRLQLARWITAPGHPLTARIAVNRLWLHHFGEGLVATPSDFGLNGARPSHPELLDWLAAELVSPGGAAEPWSLKHLHRLMVRSATYRQASFGGSPEVRTTALRKDGGNRLLWKYPARRLDAEPLRDAMLAVAGLLDLRMGGPGWSPFEPNENYVRVYQAKERFEPGDFRRMVYAVNVRQRPEGVFGVFDCPDGGQIAPKRARSTTPLQALNLLNSGFMTQVAEGFADRLRREAGAMPEAQVRRAFELAFQRPPEAAEQQAAMRFIEAEGLPLFTRALLNANEFAFVD